MNRSDLDLKFARDSVLLVAEGDSWFDFPLHADLIGKLRRSGYAVCDVADPSHTLKFMATSPHQQAEFGDEIRALAAGDRKPAAILLSGGGNDLVDFLPLLLNKFDPNSPTLNQSEVDEFVKNHLRRYYKEWLRFVTTTCDDAFQDDERIPIFIHGYAYAVPDGRRNPFAGPWLRDEFIRKGHLDRRQNTKTMESLVDKFNDVLSVLHKEHDLAHVRYVNLRKTLSNDLRKANGRRKYKQDWRDELHPTNQGFNKVASVFSDLIDEL